jgi:hypothetical protein
MTSNLATESVRIGDAIRAELFKVVRRRMTYILLLSLAALVLLFYVLLWYRIYEGPRRPRGHALSEWLELKQTMAFASVVPYGLGLEPALLRKAVLFGPHTGNFRESAEVLLAAGGAVLVRDGAELERRVDLLLGDVELRRRMGEAAFQALVGRQGAVKHTLELVERFLMAPVHG